MDDIKPDQPVKQPRKCPSCGKILDSDSDFCDNCGAELSPARRDVSEVGVAPDAFSRRKTLAARYFSIAVAGLTAIFIFSRGAEYFNDWRQYREDFIIASYEAAKLGLTYERVAQNPSAYGNAAVSWRLLMYGTVGYYEGDWKKPVAMKDASSSRNSVNSGEPHLFRIVARIIGRDAKGAIVIDEIK